MPYSFQEIANSLDDISLTCHSCNGFGEKNGRDCISCGATGLVTEIDILDEDFTTELLSFTQITAPAEEV